MSFLKTLVVCFLALSFFTCAAGCFDDDDNDDATPVDDDTTPLDDDTADDDASPDDDITPDDDVTPDDDTTPIDDDTTPVDDDTTPVDDDTTPVDDDTTPVDDDTTPVDDDTTPDDDTMADDDTADDDTAPGEGWIVTYDHPAHDIDEAKAVFVDAAGNVFVTVTSCTHALSSTCIYSDIFVYKYTAAGDLVWSAQFDGPIHGRDESYDLTLDNAGNVIVVGDTQESRGTYAYEREPLVLKYDPDGTLLWTATVTDTIDGFNYFYAVAVDADNNIYAAGKFFYDYLLVKYDPDGAEQWRMIYQGPPHELDYAVDVAVDGDGDVVVTGLSCGEYDYFEEECIRYDYATLKLDDQGVEQWEARYEGSDAWVEVDKLALDGDGNVTVFGTDGAVHYNADGVEQWTMTTSYYGDIAADAAGNVYITGFVSTDGVGCFTGKYDEDGQELWTATYSGPTEYDIGEVIDVNTAGDVFVAGTTEVEYDLEHLLALQYNDLGQQQWVDVYDGGDQSPWYYTGIDANDAGQTAAILLTWDDVSTNAMTLFYDSDGETAWTKTYDNVVDNMDTVTDLEIDPDGNTLLLAYSYHLDREFLLAKYNPAGERLWIIRYADPEGYSAWAGDIEIDSDGNIIIAGNCDHWSTSHDLLTLKYSPAGKLIWTQRYHYRLDDVPYDLVLDDADNIFVAGYSHPDSGPADAIVIKYNADGVEQWVARYAGPDGHWDQFDEIALDAEGNVIAAGFIVNDETGKDIFVVKYSPSGELIWEAEFSLTTHYDKVNDMVVGPAGNIYLTGYSDQEDENNNMITLKFSADGELLWSDVYNALGLNTYETGYQLRLDGRGRLYAIGRHYSTDHAYAMLIKYDLHGQRLWVRTYDDAYFHDITLDADGHVLISGEVRDEEENEPMMLFKYTPAGNLSWAIIYEEDEHARYDGVHVRIDDSGDVYLAGNACLYGNNICDVALIKYVWP